MQQDAFFASAEGIDTAITCRYWENLRRGGY